MTVYTNPVVGVFKYILLFAMIFLILYYKLAHTGVNMVEYKSREKYNESESMYLVDSDNCHIPSFNPFTLDVMIKLIKKPPIKCSKHPALVQKYYNHENDQYFLNINYNLAELYNTSVNGFECCYKPIIRLTDNKIKLLDCQRFSTQALNFTISRNIDYMLIECRELNNQSIIYQEGFFFIQKRLNNFKPNPQDFGILMFGMDSMSQFNVRRTMPNTVRYLQKNGWFELSGYNKIDDNTFPNLMAILTGLNATAIDKFCQPSKSGGLDNCPTLFKTLQGQGFYTALAEDDQSMSTFNFGKAGFLKPPTDYYERPLLLALEKYLPYLKHYGQRLCIGQKFYTEYIYDFGREFAERYLGEKIFGLFWTNSATHNNWRGARALDDLIVNYFQDFEKLDIFQHNVVIFFSDHGSRWGFLRNRKEGFFEERLPMFFIWLPPKLLAQYPKAINYLKNNQHRLTSPYDVHATIQNLAKMTQYNGRNDTLSIITSKNLACESCETLLKPVPWQRTCWDAGIADHWCSCHPYYSLNKTSSLLINHTQQIIKHINDYLQDNNVTLSCAPLQFKRITEANLKINLVLPYFYDTAKWLHYRITFVVEPHRAKFDASYQYNINSRQLKFDINMISRLNRYAMYSHCVQDPKLKKFCMCYKNL